MLGSSVGAMTTLFPLPSPPLPEFTTLLLKGPYHASAPVHLCLTHLANRPGTRAVLLTPSRDNFVTALRDLNDDWLNECGGFGTVSQILSRVEVLSVFSYPAAVYELNACIQIPSHRVSGIAGTLDAQSFAS